MGLNRLGVRFHDDIEMKPAKTSGAVMVTVPSLAILLSKPTSVYPESDSMYTCMIDGIPLAWTDAGTVIEKPSSSGVQSAASKNLR